MILTTTSIEDKIGKIYTNYDIAYVGKHFSNAFLKWNKLFIKDVDDAITHLSSFHTGITCTLAMNHFLSPIGTIHIITGCVFNIDLLVRIMHQSHLERIDNHAPISRPPTIPSMTSSHYQFFKDGGFLYGDRIEIVRKIGKRKRPLFNYKNARTGDIMYDIDFYSPFAFDDNIAYAWAPDGHKYKLSIMGWKIIVENIKKKGSLNENNEYFLNNNSPYISKENITEQRIIRNKINRIVHRVLKEYISKAVRT